MRRGLLREEFEPAPPLTMAGLAEGRRCARGAQCVQARWLDGQPAQLRSTSVDTICGACREKARDAQVPSSAARAEKTDTAEQWPVPEEYGELFRAAQVLLDAGITDEDEIIPTLVFAAMSWEMPVLERVRKRFIEAGDDPQIRDQLRANFREEFNGLFVSRIEDRTLVLWQKDAYCIAHLHPETGLVEKVEIEVYRRAAKPATVAELYEMCLRQYGVPFDGGSGSFAWWLFEGTLRMLVRPRDLDVHPLGAHFVQTRPETRQLPFPPPHFVGDMYEPVLRGPAKEEFLVDRMGGGPPRAHNLIPACLAWYLGGRGEKIKNREAKLTIAKLLNEHVLRPRGMEELPESTWSSKDHIWRVANNPVMVERIARLECELRRRGALLSKSF